MKNIFKNSIVLTTFVFLLCMLFACCGARKVEKTRSANLVKTESEIVDKTKTVAELNVKQEVIKVIDNKDESVTEVIIYTPIDQTKPAIIIDEKGNQHSLSNSVFRSEKVVRKNNTHTTENTNIGLTDKAEMQKDLKELTSNFNESSSNNVVGERQAWSMWNLLWLLIPVGILVLIFTYKGKIWWI